ncbi:MAG: hypothetical protein IJE00_00335 [Clostridia bacterium]|nr:hypothetical protein [Clostridia bacterium]MBQ2938795.1 hypothetical protein [Clostridia bacterium]
MLLRKDFRQPLYYENKNPLTGSDGNLRFAIEPVLKDADGNPIKKPKELLVTAWPGPYCREATDESLWQRSLFPLDEDGLNAAIAWLNSVEL